MPKPSSAFAASRMISRSESLPITIEPGGLLMHSPRLFCQRAGRDVLAVVRAVKLDLARGFVGTSDCRLQVFRAGRYSEHSPPGGVIRAIPCTGAGVEYFHTFHFVRFFNPGNFLPNFDLTSVSARRHHDAHGGNR